MNVLNFVSRCSKIVKSATYISTRLNSSNSSAKIQQLLQSSINLTDDCVKRLKELSAKYPNKYLRVGVEGGGCSGFQYIFNLDTNINDDDCIVEREGVKVLVDKESLQYFEGATVDFQTELIRSAFRILKNPKAEHGCSCGVSFSLKL